MKKLLSFHNDASIKEKYLARVRMHAQADEIIKGTYWEEGKGCAIGCTIHGSQHLKYETELGIPMILAKLEDKIFENLPNDLAKTWPERFLEAIPIGKDLSKVWPQFAIFLLTDISQCASRHPQCDIIANKFEEQIEEKCSDWKTAAATAYAATDAAYAAYAAAYAAFAAATAYATAYAAYAAADSATDAFAAAARSKAYIAQSEKLLELLRNI